MGVVRTTACHANPQVKYRLAWMYEHGSPCNDVDLPRALDLYHEAVMMGHAQAAYRLGVMYKNRAIKGDNDDAKATCLEMLKFAAHEGIADAQLASLGQHLQLEK